MDLPSCPACGQSVLDENPETCPFCGASMSGKPGDQPSKPKSSSPKPGGGKTSAGAAPTGKKPTGKPAKDDTDPFDIQTSDQKASVRVALRPAKGRSHQVKCPMCETEGYVPESAAEKNVKCANPSCMVPIFEAPPLPKEEEPEPEPEKKTSPAMILAAISMIGVAGFSVWHFVLKEGPQRARPQQAPVEETGSSGFPGGEDPPNGDPESNGADPKGPVQPKIDLVAFRQELLDQTMLSIAVSRQRNSATNRSPQFCRQQVSEAYARIGQVEKAIDQLQHIDKRDPNIFFKERLPALIEIGWKQLQAGVEAGLKKTLEQAEKAAGEVSPAGRSRFDRLTGLAALLYANGQTAEAAKWVKAATDEANISDPERSFRLRQASSHLRVLADLPSYQFNPEIDDPLSQREQPEAVTVAMLLLAHGKTTEAYEWSRQQPQRVRSDCLSAILKWQIAQKKITPAELEKTIAAESPVTQVRLLSASSVTYRESGNAAAADQLLEKAVAKVAEIEQSDEFQVPKPSALIDLSLPDPTPTLHATLALSRLAEAQVSGGQNAAAWETLLIAAKLARSIGPTPTALSSRPHRDNDPGAEQVKAALKDSLNLTSDDALRRSFNRYKDKLNSLEGIAATRVKWLVALLQEAVDYGMADRVWEEMRKRIDETNDDLKEPLLQTPLLSLVRSSLAESKDTKAVEEIKLRLGNRQLTLDAQRSFEKALEPLLASGNFEQISGLIAQSQLDRDRMELTLVNKLREIAANGQAVAALTLIDSIPDTVIRPNFKGQPITEDLQLVREELYYFLGRGGASAGQGPELVEKVQVVLPTPTEEISLLAGIVVGLDVKPAQSKSADSLETGAGAE